MGEEFSCAPYDIRHMKLPDSDHMRAWVRITRAGLTHEASAEADDPIAAVGKALERALEAWFDKGRFGAAPSVSVVDTNDGWRANAFMFGRLATGCVTGGSTDRGEACHPDQVKAAGLAYVAALNALIRRHGIDAFVISTGAPAPHPA